MEEDERLLERILDGAEDPRDLPFGLLKHITNGFSEERKIGQGGFGEVYKGVLGERIVAVKRIHINAHTFDDKLFRREVTSLMKISHRNVVQFLGVCSGGYQKPIEKDGSGEYIWTNVLERLLCFNYIGNGSLDKHITDELRGLEWETRYEIITGICKGLRYLHKEKEIIHMDLKPANILIDHQDEKYMVPKITDFGLSRSNKNSHTVGQRYGTLEYMAPEYRDESKTTQSCDIYSLGLVIIELVTGCKDVPNKDNVLRRWRHRWKKPPTQLQYQQVTRCIDIAERCRRKKPKDRPSISEIINFLNESESTYWQISPCLDEDDILQINPLELRLPYELKNDIACLVELANGTRNCIIAFIIQLPSTKYSVHPDKGIVRPESKYSVNITVHAQDVGERDNANKFIVQSMQVEASEDLRDEDITERMFENTGKFIDEVDLMVVYECRKPQENFKNDEDTSNTPAKEFPELKNCQSSPGSSGKVEAASMECTNFNSVERRNTQHIINRVDKTKTVSYESENGAEEKMLHGSDKVDAMVVVDPSDLFLLALYQDIPNSPGETSSKENATEVTVAETNPSNNISKNTANLQKLNDTMHSLNPDVRRCLEFCSIFPRGSKLRREELVVLWIAQGFVKTNCASEDMEDVAEGYFQELVSRSFLQPEETSYDIGCFTIHDVLLYLLDKVAGDCFRIENNHRGGWEGDVPQHIQHLLIRYYDGELITQKILGLENLLTLIVYKVDEGTLVEERVFESICKRLPKLRVLAIPFILERSPRMKPNKLAVPVSISQLIHLRYLAFRTNRSCMLSLPREINKLHHIQVLDFGDGKFDEFNCIDLINLRHINSGCSDFQFVNISSLTSIQTISSIFGISNAPGHEVKQLRDLNKLRGRLEITGLECIKSKEEALESNLPAKKRLTELKLKWAHSSPEVQSAVLEGLCPPMGLKKLDLYCYSGKRYPDWMVDKQDGGPKDLEELMFFSCSQLGQAPQLGEAFPHLRVLKFSYCFWDVLPGNLDQLTSLKKLEIEWCTKIRSLPTLPQSLEEFCVEWCNEGFMKSCQTFRHPNWQKIEHVPRKKIEGLSPMQDVDTMLRSGINHLTGFWRRKKV